MVNPAGNKGKGGGRAGIGNVFLMNGRLGPSPGLARQPGDYFDDGRPKAASSGNMLIASSREQGQARNRSALTVQSPEGSPRDRDEKRSPKVGGTVAARNIRYELSVMQNHGPKASPMLLTAMLRIIDMHAEIEDLPPDVLKDIVYQYVLHLRQILSNR